MSALYYEGDGVTLYHGDYRDVLPALAPLGADLVCTDPPYGDTALSWDRSSARGWLAQVRPHLAPAGTVWFFASLRYLLQLAPEFAGWQVAQDVVWEKQNGSGFAADRFRRVHEHALHLYPAGVAWGSVYKAVPRIAGEARHASRVVKVGPRAAHLGSIAEGVYEYGDTRQARSVIYARNCHGRALHPTQKPDALVRPLVESSCPPGGLVLDCFAGSGTTGEVARATGRRAVLVEENERYCDAIATRLSAAPSDLFSGAPA